MLDLLSAVLPVVTGGFVVLTLFWYEWWVAALVSACYAVYGLVAALEGDNVACAVNLAISALWAYFAWREWKNRKNKRKKRALAELGHKARAKLEEMVKNMPAPRVLSPQGSPA